jgi:hypothetical protein
MGDVVAHRKELRKQAMQAKQREQQQERPLRYNSEFSDASQDKEFAELSGLRLDQEGTTSLPAAKKAWQQTTDPLLLQKRVTIGRANDAYLARMRKQKEAAVIARSAELAALVPDGRTATATEMRAFMDRLAIEETRANPAALTPVHEVYDIGSDTLPDPAPPLSWRDTAYGRHRAPPKQPPPAPQPQDTAWARSRAEDQRRAEAYAMEQRAKGAW